MGQIVIENESTYKTFRLPKVEHYDTGSKKIKAVRIKMFSHEDHYAQLEREGKAILINNPEYEIEKTGRKTIDGIFTPLFGPNNDNDAPIFTCECRKTTGASKSGQICEHCGFPVRPIETDLKIVAHIDIAPYHILTYHGINALKKFIKPLDAVWSTSKTINIKGKTVPRDAPTLVELYDEYDDKYYPLTGLKKKYAFTSKIPVYSSRLRPFIRKGTRVQVLGVNLKYESIVILEQQLRSISRLKGDLPIQRNLNQIQKDFIDICKHVTDQMSGKTGIIRSFMASGRIDYSSRMVIVLGDDLMPHEVDIPYQTFMVLYEEEIVNRYARLNNCGVHKAIKAHTRALYYYDKVFANIMNDMCKSKDGMWALLNRTPTLNEMGVPKMKIRKIHDTYDDYTLHIPPDILTPMGADSAKAAPLSQSRSAMEVIPYKNKTVNASSAVCIRLYSSMLTVSATIRLDIA